MKSFKEWFDNKILLEQQPEQQYRRIYGPSFDPYRGAPASIPARVATSAITGIGSQLEKASDTGVGGGSPAPPDWSSVIQGYEDLKDPRVIGISGYYPHLPTDVVMEDLCRIDIGRMFGRDDKTDVEQFFLKHGLSRSRVCRDAAPQAEENKETQQISRDKVKQVIKNYERKGYKVLHPFEIKRQLELGDDKISIDFVPKGLEGGKAKADPSAAEQFIKSRIIAELKHKGAINHFDITKMKIAKRQFFGEGAKRQVVVVYAVPKIEEDVELSKEYK